MFGHYIDYCVDCDRPFTKTGPRMIRCRDCQRKHSMELERINSREYYHNVVKVKKNATGNSDCNS